MLCPDIRQLGCTVWPKPFFGSFWANAGKAILTLFLSFMGTVVIGADYLLGEEAVISPGELARRLKKEHPRLFISKDTPNRLKGEIRQNRLLEKWDSDLRAEAKKLLESEPSKYEVPDGKRLLATSKKVLGRVYTLAFMYLLDGQMAYAERAWRELEAAANFNDWNPAHFLDTAEMTHAFAVGYDWLYDVWTDSQRAILRSALMEKGLLPGVDCYRAKVRYGWWVRCKHNWNQVCNGGLAIGALAIADEAPEVAGEILTGALMSIKLPMAEFAPDGAWGEGPGYWNYATSYNVAFLAALESALGTDFGLAQTPGFSVTGLFPIYISGPTGYAFNYADAGLHKLHPVQMFWFARKFNQPVYAWFEQERAVPHPLDLVWFVKEAQDPVKANLPLDKYFRKSEVVCLRGAWDDPNATFIALKAGDNKFNHSHLDIGTFVMEALGQRWAVELGPDNYNLPGYFGGNRWKYYRLRAEGHNTLVINPGIGPDQEPSAVATIIRFESKPAAALAIADLTPAYARHARQVLRGVRMMGRRDVLLQDEIIAHRPSDIWWFMHTQAKIDLSQDGRTATLIQGEARLSLRLVSPKEGRFVIMDPTPLPEAPNPAGQGVNKGIRKLALHFKDTLETRIMVLMSPLEGENARSEMYPELSPLSEWRLD